MNRAILAADDEGRFGPGLGTHPVGQVVGAHHAEEAEEGTFAFAEDDGATANNGGLGGFGGVVNALFLFGRSDGEDACEETGGPEALFCDSAVVGDVAAHFEAARDSLRVIAFDAAARGKIRRTAENEIELLVGFKNVRAAEVAVANVETIPKAVPLD